MNSKTSYRRLLSQATNEKPKYSYQDLLNLRKQGEQQTSEAFTSNKKEHASKLIVGRSGILPIHQHCSIDNYVVNCQEQGNALSYATWFINGFAKNNGSSFIFSGTTGTGKNHLSAAICNALMANGKRCLIITVSELMMRLNSCYGDNAKITEEQFFDGMINLDLLVIDEVGLGRTSNNAANNERLAINQIVDKRLCHLKPTGILTNLGKKEINQQLGARIMDRMRTDGGQWIEFNWNSFRN
ncbi:MAG: ATP-binding protein [Pseudoalteromonas sp.]|uniref:ATP-binding protein n=1 Tax=Pseudoalteromonas sp. TaxID=53249 RepID=UPI001E13A8BD|nr:ATP-binding protein [Pseudoalteromonas sp.]NRA81181.1 ATP-binding protein [Pseudoalteromonas sp.]